MKKIKWLLCISFIFLAVLSSGFSVKAENEYEYSENDDGTITITGYTGTDETVVIPSKIDGKDVKIIKLNYDNRRRNDETIKCLTISEGITHIMRYSFKNCKNLESVFLPSTIQTIGDWAFDECSNLKEINLPEGLTSIGENAFDDCGRLENIILPNSLTSIGKYAFSGCRGVSKITIPGNLKVVELGAFFNCYNLQEVKIEEGVTKIEGAFRACNKLEKVIISNSVSYIDYYAFVVKGYSLPEGLEIYADPNSYARTYASKVGIKFNCVNTHDWDSGVTTIEATAISDGEIIYTCTACGTKKTEKVSKSGLPKKGNSVTNPNSQDTYKVTKPATQDRTVEFAKVDKTKSSITIPDTITVDGITYKVTSISKNAFKNNKNLKKVTIGKNITTIGSNAFYGCKNLKTVTIKSTQVKSIGKNAFKGIHSKAKIKVPAKKLKNYKKLLKNKGQKTTVKITK